MEHRLDEYLFSYQFNKKGVYHDEETQSQAFHFDGRSADDTARLDYRVRPDTYRALPRSDCAIGR
jgi:hypothetical protein